MTINEIKGLTKFLNDDDVENIKKQIKDKEVPKITDELIEVEELFKTKKYKLIEEKLAKIELDIYYVKSKAQFLLGEIKEITLSESKNREIVTKLKTSYRNIFLKYNNQ